MDTSKQNRLGKRFEALGYGSGVKAMYSRVHPMGVVRYKPDKCWNGLTIIPASDTASARGAVLYDMNGNIIKRWEGLFGAFDNKMLPGGSIMGTTGFNKGYWLDALNLVQMTWDGELEWSFSDVEEVIDINTGEFRMSARQHHDYQREGSPVGYYAPGLEPLHKGKTLVNATVNRDLPEFSPHKVGDTKIMELDENGKVLWSWSLFDHWDQLGIETIGKVIHKHFSKAVQPAEGIKYVKDSYCNNINYLGPNKWYDAGDKRFHPENIITDVRNLNVSFIIDRETGDVVWRIGPDFEASKELQDIGQIVGQHHVHMIPKGLPGEGNILIFDNGGQAGLGKPTPCCPTGFNNATRSYSRVVEINPVTLKVEWAFNDENLHFQGPEKRSFQDLLFSEYCSSADRLPNGNTMITEAVRGRVIEVTPEREIVWEFYNPGKFVFRAHRYPYEWFPQVKKPEETPVTPRRNFCYRIKGDGTPYLIEDDPFFADPEES